MAKRKTRGRAKLTLIESAARTISIYRRNPELEADELLESDDPPPIVGLCAVRMRKDHIGQLMARCIVLLEEGGVDDERIQCYRSRIDEIRALNSDGQIGEALVAAVDFGISVQATLLEPLDELATNGLLRKAGQKEGGRKSGRRSREKAPGWQREINDRVAAGCSYTAAKETIAQRERVHPDTIGNWTKNPKPRKKRKKV